MHPTTGAVYLGGRVGMLHDKDCLWDFTNETYADNIADTQIWPYLAKFTKTMDWPATRG